MKLLFTPHVTLAMTVAACVATTSMCAGVIATLAPLETIHGLESVRPVLDKSIVVLGVLSTICTVLAGLGRSFIRAIDEYHAAEANPLQAPPKGP